MVYEVYAIKCGLTQQMTQTLYAVYEISGNDVEQNNEQEKLVCSCLRPDN